MWVSAELWEIYWKEIEERLVKKGYCTKYQMGCDVGGDPPSWTPDHVCSHGLVPWALESSTGCPNWKTPW